MLLMRLLCAKFSPKQNIGNQYSTSKPCHFVYLKGTLHVNRQKYSSCRILSCFFFFFYRSIVRTPYLLHKKARVEIFAISMASLFMKRCARIWFSCYSTWRLVGDCQKYAYTAYCKMLAKHAFNLGVLVFQLFYISI